MWKVHLWLGGRENECSLLQFKPDQMIWKLCGQKWWKTTTLWPFCLASRPLSMSLTKNELMWWPLHRQCLVVCSWTSHCYTPIISLYWQQCQRIHGTLTSMLFCPTLDYKNILSIALLLLFPHLRHPRFRFAAKTCRLVTIQPTKYLVIIAFHVEFHQLHCSVLVSMDAIRFSPGLINVQVPQVSGVKYQPFLLTSLQKSNVPISKREVAEQVKGVPWDMITGFPIISLQNMYFSPAYILVRNTNNQLNSNAIARLTDPNWMKCWNTVPSGFKIN